MPGNPFLNFLYQSIVEIPAFIMGKYFGEWHQKELPIGHWLAANLMALLYLFFFNFYRRQIWSTLNQFGIISSCLCYLPPHHYVSHGWTLWDGIDLFGHLHQVPQCLNILYGQSAMSGDISNLHETNGTCVGHNFGKWHWCIGTVFGLSGDESEYLCTLLYIGHPVSAGRNQCPLPARDTAQEATRHHGGGHKLWQARCKKHHRQHLIYNLNYAKQP